MTGAESLVRSLEAAGVDVAFGIPGGAILPLYDPLMDSPKVRHILARHEQGAGHAAEGYAQATGRVGVCMATSGPGATNLVTPIADAYMDSVPIVAITGQVARPAIGTDAFQEADIQGITLPITKHNFLIQTPEEIPGITLESFLRTAQAAVTGKPVKVMKFRHELAAQMDALNMDPAYADRYLNVGFSGGEKKKAEILQLLMLKPALALLDETDSGLDVDAVKTVANGIKAYHNDTNALIIITHNAKILEGLQVDYVHVLDDARIVRTGNGELVSEIIEEGFAALKEDEAK